MDGADSMIPRFASYESRVAAFNNNVHGTAPKANKTGPISSVHLTGLNPHDIENQSLDPRFYQYAAARCRKRLSRARRLLILGWNVPSLGEPLPVGKIAPLDKQTGPKWESQRVGTHPKDVDTKKV